MKKLILCCCMLLLGVSSMAQNRYEEQFTRPLDEVLQEVAQRFDVKIKVDAPTQGLMLPYADFRVRPYSIEETLHALLWPFDLTFSKSDERNYAVKPFEYYSRTCF